MRDASSPGLLSADFEDRTLRCIRCGLCLDACPTFRLTGNEAQSPRGRIRLMRDAAAAGLATDAPASSQLDACLGCRACEAACPSGVGYGAALEEFREASDQAGWRPGLERLARRALIEALTRPRLLLALLRAAHALPSRCRVLPRWVALTLTGQRGAPVVLPATPHRPRLGRLPAKAQALAPRRAAVGVLEGCVMRVLFAETNEATVRVLQRAGCDVFAPCEAGCCGALDAHAGRLEAARRKARALIDAFRAHALDAIVVNSAGCGSAMKAYGTLLAGDPQYAEQARAFAARVRDASEYLAEAGGPPPEGRFDALVAYHDACHLAHAQRVTAAPRRLLSAVPGLRLVDLPESDTCCGSAGIYNLTHPRMAVRLLERKVDAIAATGAAVVAAGNPGCIAWMREGVRRRGLAVRVLHPVEILDEAAGG
ncbi:MAG TPA: heterodisulfide reductase-related iron-sulfur binding cluster [Chthonomonadales bacterium]|nr:heterodisulfide reductase-related iron-sulfur binding cluster [Chthonomonadales bacterium]